MTAVLCWINRECDHVVLWAASDSRISPSSGNAIAQPLTDSCPKIFSIPILASKTLDEKKHDLYSIGFAYAGSALVSLATKDVVARLLGNLVESKFVDRRGQTVPAEMISATSRIPAIFEVAQLIAKVASKYVRDVGQYFPLQANAEFAVFGFCPRSAEYVAYKISGDLKTPCDLSVSKVSINSGEILQLGNKKKEIADRIVEIRSKHAPDEIEWCRAPIKALANVIGDESAPGIGGYGQVSICTPIGIAEFQMFDVLSSSPSYFGFDIEKDLPPLAGYETEFCGLVW